MPWGDSTVLFTFLAVTSGVLLLALLAGSRHRRLEERIEGLARGEHAAPPPNPTIVRQFTRSALPRLGAPLVPKSEKDRTHLANRLVHAGLYSRQALAIFLGVKMLLALAAVLLGVLAGLSQVVSMTTGLCFGLIGGGLGMIGPSFWLDYRKKHRQTELRRALPDALDVIIICLEGGMSLPAALDRLVRESRLAHPLLGVELAIVQREIQLGCSTGEALQLFGVRCDLEEVRSLAAVVLQAERYGSSLAKAMKVHAESLRIKHMQRAEELAQKAVIKVLFPTTILFIFPALFLVILGPAAIQVKDILNDRAGFSCTTLARW